jgi:MoaA/NifB/PqqE/SkfB family radical SAM enzyme
MAKGTTAFIIDSENHKVLRSANYNYMFDRKTGNFARWGKTREDDPQFGPFGPELMDIEISTICKKACKWCYKSNTSKGTYMSFDTFKKLFAKFPKTLTQIAFGIGDIRGNPDIWKIMQYCRDNKIVPNVTINGDGITKSIAKKLVSVCGAIAVSDYGEVCYKTVKQLTDLGHTQINIHALLCNETYDNCFKLIDDSISDKRLEKLNAMVFLWLKPKGKRNVFTPIKSLAKYKALVDYAFLNKARIGFDSCSASSFLKTIEDRVDYKQIAQMVEPCESTLFSYYINVDGVGYPCSFTEGEDGFKGINVLRCKDFVKGVWYNKETVKFRARNCKNCRQCQAFDLSVEEDIKGEDKVRVCK